MTDYSAIASQFGGTTEPSSTDYSALAAKFGGQPVQADPQIGNPQELTFAERYIAPILEKTGLGNLQGGNAKGAWEGRAFQGLADPGTSIVQLAANVLPGDSGKEFNAAVKQNEQDYQASRAANGSSGFDPLRLAGNTAMSAFIAGAMPEIPQTGPVGNIIAGGPLRQSALQGLGYSALTPVTNGGENYWTDKAKDEAIGATVAPLTTLAGQAVGRIVSPNASVNPDLQMLRDAGVRPTIGQTLGGWANTLEEKAQSLPIVGDAIAAARRRSMGDFNKAILDTAEAPVGGAATGAGFDAVAHAGDTLRAAYNKAASDVGQVNLDGPAFNDGLQQVMDKASGLSQPMQDQFKKILNEEVYRRMGPDGSVLGDNIKVIDSALGKAAADWNRYTNPQTERELGGVIRQLQQTFRDGLAEASPTYDAARQAADQGWRVFRLARNAAAAAKNREGVFTPAQLNSAIQSDAGKAAVGEGRAFMQDAATAGQNVLGNKYPDSGTVGRLLINALAIPGHIATGGATAAGLGAAALGYTPVAQNALRALVASRPESAPAVANYLRRLTQAAGVASVPAVEQYQNAR